MDTCYGPLLDILSERDNLFEETLFLGAIMRPHIPAIGGFVVAAQMLRAHGTSVGVSEVDS